MQNHLNGFRLASREVAEYAPKPEEFYEYGIYKPVNRWNELLGNNGDYVND